jgi:predicted HTH domain antitoxin
MTKFSYDDFAKGFLEALLSPFGTVEPSYKIAAEVREVDVYFIPLSNNLDRTDLGLLGKCATSPVAIEPFRNSVSVPQIRACMSKLYDLHADLYRAAKRDKQPEPKDDVLPTLWILTPTLSDNILTNLGAALDTDRGEGVYLLPLAQKTGIVVIHRLPKTPETLWFRLLGKEGVQRRAIEEVAQLPNGHPYRQNTLELLGNLKVTLEARTNIQPEDRDLIMQLSPLYLEKIQAAKHEGEQQKQQEIAVNLLRKNISLEVISETTGVSIEQLQILRSQLQGSQAIDPTSSDRV